MGNKANSSSDNTNKNNTHYSQQIINDAFDNNGQSYDDIEHHRCIFIELLQQPASSENSNENTPVDVHVRSEQVMGSLTSSKPASADVRKKPESLVS
jgi:hypothetical protein